MYAITPARSSVAAGPLFARYALAAAAVVAAGTGCQHPEVVLVPLPPDIEYPWAEQPTSAVASIATAEQRVDVAATNAISIVRSNADAFVFTVDEVAVDEVAVLAPPERSPPESDAQVHRQERDEQPTEPDQESALIEDRSDVEEGVPVEGNADLGPSVNVAATSDCVDVNAASLSQLESLPRIGPAMSARIVEARPFRRNRDLLDVSGIGPATYARFEGELCPD